MSKKGEILSSSAREIIFNVMQFCECEKEAKIPIIDLNKAMDRVAAMTGLSRHTVLKIRKERATNGGVWCTPGQNRPGRPKKIILSDFEKRVIRNKIRDFYTIRDEGPSLRKLHKLLKEEIHFCGGISTLHVILREMGYTYKTCGSKRKKILFEPSNQDIVCEVNVQEMAKHNIELTKKHMPR